MSLIAGVGHCAGVADRHYLPMVHEDRTALLREVATHYALGALEGAPVQCHGGVNTLWRLRTSCGEFSVHEMATVAHDADPVERCQRAFDLEVAAAAAGVAVAPPVPDPETGNACAVFSNFAGPVVVHHWINAEPVQLGRTKTATYEALGRSLALVHRLEPSITPGSPDLLERHPTADSWRALARQGAALGWQWGPIIGSAADELAEGLAIADAWDRSSAETRVVSHRDLTSANVLDDFGTPVLIDWEDAGLITPGTEIGRTALDNLGRDGELDAPALRAYLSGYQSAGPLPAVGRHWCSLWVRGLIVFAEHCARSCVSGTTPRSLLERQLTVLENTVPELRRRLSITDSLVGAFAEALP